MKECLNDDPVKVINAGLYVIIPGRDEYKDNYRLSHLSDSFRRNEKLFDS